MQSFDDCPSIFQGPVDLPQPEDPTLRLLRRYRQQDVGTSSTRGVCPEWAQAREHATAFRDRTTEPTVTNHSSRLAQQHYQHGAAMLTGLYEEMFHCSLDRPPMVQRADLAQQMWADAAQPLSSGTQMMSKHQTSPAVSAAVSRPSSSSSSTATPPFSRFATKEMLARQSDALRGFPTTQSKPPHSSQRSGVDAVEYGVASHFRPVVDTLNAPSESGLRTYVPHHNSTTADHHYDSDHRHHQVAATANSEQDPTPRAALRLLENLLNHLRATSTAVDYIAGLRVDVGRGCLTATIDVEKLFRVDRVSGFASHTSDRSSALLSQEAANHHGRASAATMVSPAMMVETLRMMHGSMVEVRLLPTMASRRTPYDHPPPPPPPPSQVLSLPRQQRSASSSARPAAVAAQNQQHKTTPRSNSNRTSPQLSINVFRDQECRTVHAVGRMSQTALRTMTSAALAPHAHDVYSFDALLPQQGVVQRDDVVLALVLLDHLLLPSSSPSGMPNATRKDCEHPFEPQYLEQRCALQWFVGDATNRAASSSSAPSLGSGSLSAGAGGWWQFSEGHALAAAIQLCRDRHKKQGPSPSHDVPRVHATHHQHHDGRLVTVTTQSRPTSSSTIAPSALVDPRAVMLQMYHPFTLSHDDAVRLVQEASSKPTSSDYCAAASSSDLIVPDVGTAASSTKHGLMPLGCHQWGNVAAGLDAAIMLACLRRVSQ